MKTFLLAVTAYLSLSSIGTQASWASVQTIEVSNYSVTITAGETRTFYLPTTYRIEKLWIQAEGVRSDAYGQVMVNGDVKGTIYAPGHDPSYIVTVKESADSVQIVAHSGQLRILNIKATVSETHPNRRPLPSYHQSVMGEVSSRIIWLVNELERYTNYGDYGTHLLPIRKSAAQALAIAEARGDASASARPYYVALLNDLDRAEAFLQNAYEIDVAFDNAVELMSQREKIRLILN